MEKLQNPWTHSLPIALVLLLGACSGKVVVGEPRDHASELNIEGQEEPSNMPSPNDVRVSSGGSPAVAAEDCAEEFAALRQPYLDWKAAENDFGSLAGSVFTGYVEGGADLTLTIDEEQTANLIVGEAAPAPVEAEEGYLCHEVERCNTWSALVDSAVYPVQGASFQSNRLQIALKTVSPFDAWCQLQVPVQKDVCLYDVVGNASIGFGGEDPGHCTVGSDVVDCGWFELAFNVHGCACTADDCKAAPGSDHLMDLRYIAEEDKLEGSVTYANGEAQNVQLFRSAE